MATETTKIPYVEGAAAATPAANRVVTYAKADGLMYSKDDAGVETLMSSGGAGSVATDAIWDAAGDLAVGSGANTAARLAIGATNGMAVRRVSGAVAWDLPPGHEFTYVEHTSTVSPTATTEAGADTVVTAAAVTFDGSTTVLIEYFCGDAEASGGAAGRSLVLWLYDGASSIGYLGLIVGPTNTSDRRPIHVFRRLTPSAASHTYSIRASVSAGTGNLYSGAGGTATALPAYIRITKV